MNNDVKNYYDILEVPHTSSSEEIYEGYLRAKNTYSGDGLAMYSIMTKDECDEMLELIEAAYSILSVPHKRKEYDIVRGIEARKFLQQNNYQNNDSNNNNSSATGATAIKNTFFESNSTTGGAEVDDFAIMANLAYEHSQNFQYSNTSFINNSGSTMNNNNNSSNSRTTSKSNSKSNSNSTKGNESFVSASASSSSLGTVSFSAVGANPKSNTYTIATNTDKDFQIHRNDMDISRLTAQKRFALEYDIKAEMEEKIESMAEFTGTFLKEIREYKNVSIEKMCDLIKISRTYVKQIEEEEYSKLPALPYVRGFVYQYAKCLRLNPDLVANSYIEHVKSLQRIKKSK
ncbi:MAG: helix-turn-helix domain-containing protein [Oligoflexia bacterium]|nr:helix-turn-helix domain-containing protein [Oligoflexia bacterium]